MGTPCENLIHRGHAKLEPESLEISTREELEGIFHEPVCLAPCTSYVTVQQVQTVATGGQQKPTVFQRPAPDRKMPCISAVIRLMLDIAITSMDHESLNVESGDS